MIDYILRKRQLIEKICRKVASDPVSRSPFGRWRLVVDDLW